MDYNKLKTRAQKKREDNEEYAKACRIDLSPVGAAQLEIQKIANDIRGSNVLNFSPQDIVTMYTNVRDARHNLWCDYLEATKKDMNMKFNDIRYGTFIKDVLCFFNPELQAVVESEDPNSPYPTQDIANKRPDILVYDRKSKTVFLGDVAVSKSRELAEKRKIDNYQKVYNHIKNELKMTVTRCNMIIEEDCRNANTAVRRMETLGLTNPDMKLLKKVKTFHHTANSVMQRLMNDCNDPRAAMVALIAYDTSSKDKKISQPLHVPIEVTSEILPEKAQLNEYHLIQQIKNVTDSNYETYFDTDYSKAKVAFSELYNKFSSKKTRGPKSTLKACYNTNDVELNSGHKLLEDYLRDIPFSQESMVSEHVLNMLPTRTQLDYMKKFDAELKDRKDRQKNEKVFGHWQYTQKIQYSDNIITRDYLAKLQLGKKIKNEQEEPRTVDPSCYEESYNRIESMIMQLGQVSDKAPFLDDSWDAKTTAEFENTKNDRDIYDYVRKSNGAQLGNAMSMLYQRVTHLSTRLSTKDNIFIPPNGAFICIIPSNHKPITRENCDLPLVFISRKKKDSTFSFPEHEMSFETLDYVYIVTKLSRLTLDKMSQWDQAGHKIIACSSYLISQNECMYNAKERIVGALSILTLDVHQKTSCLLDMLKYVSFMPFSDISRLSRLIEDKFDMMLKTRLDVWVLKSLEDFMLRLSEKENLDVVKNKLKVFNGSVLHESLGMSIKIGSFINRNDRHDEIKEFVEEISMFNIVRGKKFYGDQYMDKAICDIATWNNEFEEEVKNYGGWTEGRGEGEFPWEAKFCYSKDAIIHAVDYNAQKYPINGLMVAKMLGQIEYNGYIHEMCTLRGCTKEIYRRVKGPGDLHTTSLDECLKYYEVMEYDEEACKVLNKAMCFIKPTYTAQYSMSTKEQRAWGRLIATPTLTTKMGNACIEKPEQCIGIQMSNNILVAGKNKLLEQSKAYKLLLEKGYSEGKKYVFQCTEDQSKFSENDNTRKFYTYIRNNPWLPADVRMLQLKCMEKMINREHLIKRMPRFIKDKEPLSKWINSTKNGVRAIIGWPQGMLNNISTSVHAIASRWITYAYNRAYHTNIIVNDLIHSDDSWFAIACDDEVDLRRYSVFRAYAKRLFCLKLNDKKFWASRLLGELVSNFNINGEVLVSIGKVVSNSFGNLLYQNWVIDTNNQISTVKQLYKQGANMGTLIMMGTILRQQIISAYNLNKKAQSLMYILPIELGGYPGSSLFEIGTTGMNAHYKNVYLNVVKDPLSTVSQVILKTMRLSDIYNKKRDKQDVVNAILEFREESDLKEESQVEDDTDKNVQDFQNVIIPTRGEIFSSIQHIMPKTRKITETMREIRKIPFESDGLELIVTKPNDIKVSLGHLKAQTDALLFSLASEKYTNNKRRLAINQALQATGRTIKLVGFRPMTLEELLTFIKECKVRPLSTDVLRSSFSDDSGLVELASSIVYNSDICITNDKKGRVVNMMPEYEDKFKTICRLQNVLLYIIDYDTGSNYLSMYNKTVDDIDVLSFDAEQIRLRFKNYFEYFSDVKKTCTLIMRQFMDRIKTKLWVQPKLCNDDLETFMCELYGKSLNGKLNYRVDIDMSLGNTRNIDSKIVTSLYTTEVLNRLYPGKFSITGYDTKTYSQTLRGINYSNLSKSDYLKYCTLQLVVNNNSDFMKDYDKQKMYCQKYERRQYVERGSYVGPFSVYLKYGGMVMNIKGKPGDLTVTVNKANKIPEMLSAMFIYVNRDHPSYSYSYSNAWHSSTFWNTGLNTCSNVMFSYSGNHTVIKPRSQGTGLGVNIDPNLRYPDRDEITISATYETDETLRVIYKRTESSRIRVDNNKQNMYIPLVDKIHIEPEEIDGFDCNMLLKSKVILNITMRRQFSASLKEIQSLMRSRLPQVDNNIIGRAYLNMYKQFNVSQGITIEDVINQVEVITFDLEGFKVLDFIECHHTTTPEDLSGIELDMLHDEKETAGALIKYTSFLRLFARYMIPPTFRDKIYYFYQVTTQSDIFRDSLIDTRMAITNDDVTIYEIVDDFNNSDYNEALCCFVLSNELDREEVVKSYKLPEVYLDRDYRNCDSFMLKFANMFLSIIKECTEFTDKSPNPVLMDI